MIGTHCEDIDKLEYMKILIYDCFSGISGDMNLGAMVDLGVDAGFLTAELHKLNLKGWSIDFKKSQKHGITGTSARVTQTIHEHKHRHLSDIKKIIWESTLGDEVKHLALNIFKTIAEAEAYVHNSDIEKVHFHEVGAIDSIIDIVGAAICIHHLQPDIVTVKSHIELGGGFVKCDHGTLPVPAPATAEIVKGLPVKLNSVDFEATTPTGAAIIATLVNGKTDDLMPVKIIKTGYGTGEKEHDSIPNLLRVHLAGPATVQDGGGHEAAMVECNIDDMNPEIYHHLFDRLYSIGASEVFITNTIMKKGRPGIVLTAICEKGHEDSLADLLFEETTTIGLRIFNFRKRTLSRSFRKVSTSLGDVDFKLSFSGNRLISAKPEYEACRSIAVERNIPLKTVISKVTREFYNDTNSSCTKEAE